MVIDQTTKPTISIGLPAYNEELNIRALLERLLAQKITKGVLTEILVMSDGSTDRTVAEARSVQDSRVKIIELNERRGKFAIENKIFTTATGDVLIIFDCDVLPKDEYVIDALVEPLVKNPSIGLVGADIEPAKPRSFFESVIALSHKLKMDMYRRINNGDNLYLCHGRGRAFHRELYAPIVWPEGFPEDAFSYLHCKQKGLGFVYAPDAVVIFRPPTNFKDHMRQDHRYIAGRKKMEDFFGKEIIQKAYHIPLYIFATSVLKYICIAPIRTLTYCLVTFYLWFLAPGKRFYTTSWEISESSKKVLE